MPRGIRSSSGSGVSAESIDRKARTIRLDDGTTLGYDHLVLATGSRLRRLTVPGSRLVNVHSLRSYDQALAIAEDFAAGKRLVVVGGGFIGLEIAASARLRDLETTVVEASDRLLARVVPARIASLLARRHEDEGVTLRMGAMVERFISNGRGAVKAVELSTGETLALRCRGGRRRRCGQYRARRRGGARGRCRDPGRSAAPHLRPGDLRHRRRRHLLASPLPAPCAGRSLAECRGPRQGGGGAALGAGGRRRLRPVFLVGPVRPVAPDRRAAASRLVGGDAHPQGRRRDPVPPRAGRPHRRRDRPRHQRLDRPRHPSHAAPHRPARASGPGGPQESRGAAQVAARRRTSRCRRFRSHAAAQPLPGGA